MQLFVLIFLSSLVWMGCAFHDPPSEADLLDEEMHVCVDLPRDTLFFITERYASGRLDTTQRFLRSLDSTRAPRFAGDNWYLNAVICNDCPQIIISLPEPRTELDSARLRYQQRKDSLTIVCQGTQMDTVPLNPINRPLPMQSLYNVLAHMLDTAHGDTLRTTLPIGYGFALLGAEQGIRLIQNGQRLSVNDSMKWSMELPQTDNTKMDTLEYPKLVRPFFDSLFIPLMPQDRWGLRIWDAYGFEDSIFFAVNRDGRVPI